MTFNAKYRKIDNERFPSFFKEGWIRPHFCHIAFSASGDGVVKIKSLSLFSTTSPKSMSKICQNKALFHMDLGTPPVQEEKLLGH
jgi:hypothetical protein